MNFKKVIVSFFILSLIFTTSCRFFPKPNPVPFPVKVKSTFGYFTENKGQWNREILYVGDTKFGSVAFARDGFYYQLIKKDGIRGKYTSRLIKFVFVRPLPLTVEGENILPHFNNYFVGKEPRIWNTECRNYGTVYYKNVWNGIDMAFFFTKAGLKYEFYATPKANIDDLRIRVDGASLSVVNNSLLVNTTLGLIQDDGLTAWDQIDKTPIPATFFVQRDVYSFQGIPKLRKHTITIDPMVYSTYLGGIFTDQANAIAVDSQGYAYTAGFTHSPFDQIYPPGGLIVPTGMDQDYIADADVFVAKFAPDGITLDAFTYFGGEGIDIATAISLDSSMPYPNIYITGSTTTIVSTTNGGPPIWFDNQQGGGKDIFVLKLNSNLETQNPNSFPTFIKYIGGSGDDVANSLAIKGNFIYLTGSTKSDISTFPLSATNGGPPIWFDGQPGSPGNVNSFVIKINSDFSQPWGHAPQVNPPNPIFNFFGGNGDDIATAIAVQGDNVYITGSTTTIVSTTNGGPPIWFDGQPNTGNLGSNAFILKLGSDLREITGLDPKFIGGSEDDYATSIAVDSTGGYIYIAGYTYSSYSGNIQFNWFDTIFGGNNESDALIFKVNIP